MSMSDQLNIRSERLDFRNQRITISPKMEGRRSLHKGSPKKDNKNR